MKLFFNFKFLLLILLIISPNIIIYYYHYNYLAKVDLTTLRADGSDYKIKQIIINNKPEDDQLIYKSRSNKFEENIFKIIDNYEKPEKIDSIIENKKSIYDNHSIFISSRIDSNDEINVILTNNNDKKQISSNIRQGIYYIELGIFTSKDEAEKTLQGMQNKSKKLLKDLPSFFKFVSYKDKVFVKLIIPSINSFSEARQICRVVKEFQSTCLIKNY
jgi:hypothetical protein